ncbi:MAG: ABC transporter substrate-binding protein [Parvibaculaceae bacterium]
MRLGRALACSTLLATLLVAGQADARPSRILSFNLCADQLVLLLADKSDVQSVTWLARDCDLSIMCHEAEGLPVNYGTSEELIVAKPDILIADSYTTLPAVAIAKQLGVKVLHLDIPVTINQVRQQILDVAHALDRDDRGQAVVAAMDRQLAAIPLPASGAHRPVAALYQARGFTTGKGSLIDEVLVRAGFDNLATKLAIDDYIYMPLEELIAGQPDLLVIDGIKETRPSLASAVLRSPVLKDTFTGDHIVEVPQRLWTCGGPEVVDAIATLYDARVKLERQSR